MGAEPASEAGPCVSLTLASRPETLTLVRTMLSGFAEALALDSELLDDLKTAVSEACNNVVFHAYPDGVDGLLQIALSVDGDALVAEVRDDGVGIDALQLYGDAEEGLGIPVIRALAADTELRTRESGGTEVAMTFTAVRDGARLYALPAPVGAPDDTLTAMLAGDTVVSVSPPEVLTAVLGRLARALAATAHFSLDRFSDVYLVTDALADRVDTLAARDRIAFAITAGSKRLELTIGPLRTGSAAQLADEPRAQGQPSPLELLSDELLATPADGGEVLHVVMLDQRR